MAQRITVDAIRALYHNEPFQPFELVTQDGGVFAVPARRRLVIAPTGNFIIVVGANESLTQITLRSILEVRLRSKRTPRTRRAESRRRKAG